MIAQRAGDAVRLDQPCLLCGERAARLLVVSEDLEYRCKPGPFGVARCACGHVQAWPMPAALDIPGLYPRTYYTVNPASPLYLDGPIYRTKIARDVGRLLQLIDGTPTRRIVDIGCGDAARLFALEQRLGAGSDIDLIALDLQYEQKTRERARGSRVRLVEGDAERDLDALPDGGCDLVIMSQLIEHLRRPDLALQRLRDKLSPTGRLLIETPHVGGLDQWLFRRRCWGGYHIPRHLHLFTPTSLEALIQRCGLRRIRGGFLPSPGFWIISLRNALGLDSIARKRCAPGECFHFSSLPVVGAFTAFDLLQIALGCATSNQYLLVGRDEGSP